MTTTATRDLESGTADRNRMVIGTLLVATFVVILNETIMGVALPRLMVELGLTAGTVQWLTTAFMLTMAVVIPTTGFLLQRLSTRTVYAMAMGLFCVGTLLAGLAPGFWVLLLARVVQASGTAIMLPLLMTTVLTLVPHDRRGVVMGNISIVIAVAPAIGPTLSGLILQFLSWRFMFLLVLPVAVAALVYGLYRLVNVHSPGNQPLDLPSVALTVPAFGGIVFGLSQIGEAASGGVAWLAPVSLTVGAVCLLVFVLRQRALVSGKGPLLDLRVFGYKMFTLCIGLLCIAMTALFGVIILLPIYLQTIRGLGSLQTGLLLLPGGLLMGLLGPVVGRLFDRHGPRVLTTLGTSLIVVTMVALSMVGPTTPVPLLLATHMVLSVGLACTFTPTFTTGLNPLPPSQYSHGSAVLSTLQQVAGAMGVALLVTIMTLRSVALEQAGQPAEQALNEGLQTAFLVGAGIAVIAVVLALFMRNEGSHSQEDAVNPH